MKTMRSAVLCFVVLFLTAPMLHAQDFSKYRSFSLGTNLAAVLKHTDQRLLDVKATHDGSVLFQELTWHPANGIGVSYRSESVDELMCHVLCARAELKHRKHLRARINSQPQQ